MNLLSPEQLAEIKADDDSLRKEQAAGWRISELGKDRRALLDHIEAREQQIKSELRTLRVMALDDFFGKGDFVPFIDASAANLGIALD